MLSQLLAAPRCSGAHELMAAVLREAVDDLARCRQARSTSPYARMLEAWFARDDRTWPYAFVPLCEALGLDAALVRHRLAINRAVQAPDTRCVCGKRRHKGLCLAKRRARAASQAAYAARNRAQEAVG